MTSVSGKRIATAAGMLVMLLFLSAGISYAWFLTGHFSDKANSYTAAKEIELTLSQSSYVEENDTYIWTECYYNENRGEDFVLNDLHFGTVDNLAALKKDNVLYYRLHVPAEAGDTVFFTFSYNALEGEYQLYYFESNDPQNDILQCTESSFINGTSGADILNGLNVVEIVHESYLKFAYCLSSEVNADVTTLDFTAEEINVRDSVSQSITFDNTENVEDYYLYIKVYPNLLAYINAIDYLNACMPCIFEYNLSASFEVRDLLEGEE